MRGLEKSSRAAGVCVWGGGGGGGGGGVIINFLYKFSRFKMIKKKLDLKE